jgi:hypothetical protein
MCALAWRRGARHSTAIWIHSISAFVAALLFATAFSPLAQATSSKTKAPPAVRWSEDLPGCTFSTTQDGKYEYGFWSGDEGITLAVDAREVQIIRHRIEPIFGVRLTIRYRGTGRIDVDPGTFTLQFMNHFKVIRPPIDPDDYTEKIQKDADDLDDETRRIVAKHPEKQETQDAREQEYQKSVSELIEFLGKNSLREAHLDHGNSEASGWVFFSTDNKWIGKWKTQEEFVLRLPLDGKVFEFPFKLPPKAGELVLRKRE